ncbi:hypothetical protein [Moorena sp. SIO3H5]|uniref:hypothetical protein n=1 Tax=Moorena sp. SIO3H5 TaxID=2607834 RepID=UPI0013B87439|nr:hypothetical protein [Moorena sp. SIO3H5]NEO74703.1 hypothetical protein [Moorena sp. SIO3H5]
MPVPPRCPFYKTLTIIKTIQIIPLILLLSKANIEIHSPYSLFPVPCSLFPKIKVI